MPGRLVLQAIRGWAAADLRAWPRENRNVRIVLVLGGLEAASLGWIAVAMLGVPANMSSTKVRLEAGSSLWFALGLLVVLLLSGVPLVFYVRYVRTPPPSLFPGMALMVFLAYTLWMMVTSTSDSARLASLGPLFLNYSASAAGLAPDRLQPWPDRSTVAPWS